MNGLHIKIAKSGDTKERNGKGRDIPKIARQIGGPARGLEDEIETKSVQQQVAQSHQRRARLACPPRKNHGHLRRGH